MSDSFPGLLSETPFDKERACRKGFSTSAAEVVTLSQFVLLIDADFQVSPGIEMRFHESVDMSAVSLKDFVVPAFEWLEAGQASRVSKPVSVINRSFGYGDQDPEAKLLSESTPHL